MEPETKPYVAVVILALLVLAACERTPSYKWRQVQAPDGSFSVTFPAGAVGKDTQEKSEAGDSFILHGFTVRASKTAVYGCNWWEDPSLKDREPDQILDIVRDRGLSAVKGNLLSEKRITFQLHAARDIRAVAEGNAAYDNRVVIVGNRVYSMLVIDVSGKHDVKNVEGFFNSLVLQ